MKFKRNETNLNTIDKNSTSSDYKDKKRNIRNAKFQTYNS